MTWKVTLWKPGVWLGINLDAGNYQGLDREYRNLLVFLYKDCTNCLDVTTAVWWRYVVATIQTSLCTSNQGSLLLSMFHTCSTHVYTYISSHKCHKLEGFHTPLFNNVIFSSHFIITFQCIAIISGHGWWQTSAVQYYHTVCLVILM